MGRKKRARMSAKQILEVRMSAKQILDSIDAADMRKVGAESGEEVLVASLVAVKWAHARFAAAANELAAIVDGVCRGQDSLTPKDVGECLKETTRRLEFLKVVTDNADAGFAQRDEFDDLGGPVVGLDE